MNDITGILILTAHAAVVLAAAWLLARSFLSAAAGDLEKWLAWGWSFVALIASAGVVLGAIGVLGAGGFWVADIAVLLALALWRRPRLGADWAALRSLGRNLQDFFRTGGTEAGLALLLLGLLGSLLGLSLWAEPVVYDALTYRLPRIAQWLQDGHVGVVTADEPRINYMPVVPDLVMAWFIAGKSSGYQFGAVAQLLGGLLTVGATIGLARLTGLGRGAAIGAGLLLFGMANVVPQFTSAHTDLFTTGVFAAAFYLWLAALRRGEGSVSGGLGAGLALGSKGTLFYLAPGALGWVAWLAWRYPLPLRAWSRTVLAAVLAAAFFAGPVFVRNWRTYGGLFGPTEHVQMHHGAAEGVAGNLEKLRLNLRASFAQVLEPNSQPPWWRAPIRALGRALSDDLPEHDGHTLEGLNRRTTLLMIMDRTEPDADATSFGALTLTFFALGGITALVASRRTGARLVAVWGAGVVVFLVFFHAMQQWHPYGFRYFVLVAPWLAVVAAWWLDGLPRPLRLVLWGIAGLNCAVIAWSGTMRTFQSGWRAINEPEHARGYYVYRQWAGWSATLDGSAEALRVALPDRRPLAAFYRQPGQRPTLLRHQPAATAGSAAEFAGAEEGWVIVPAAQFIGREGSVMARCWLFEGDEQSPFSLAAYRQRPAGEIPPPVLYRARPTFAGNEVRWDLLVKAWAQPAVRLRFRNPGPTVWTYRISIAGGHTGGELPGGPPQMVTLQLPANEVSQVLVDFRAPEGTPPGAAPTVELVP